MRIKTARIPTEKPVAAPSASTISNKDVPYNYSVYGKTIPYEIQQELDYITEFTKKHDKEAILTICQKPGDDRYFVAGHEEGDESHVKIPVCNRKFGKTIQVGTIHTHPTIVDSIGLTPSDSDITETLADSYNFQNKQTDCILNAGAKYMHCYSPRKNPTARQVENYMNSTERSPGIYSDKYIVDHAKEDFSHFWYRRDNWTLVEDPPAKEIVKCAIEKSRPYIREKIKTMERQPFCNLVQDLNKPRDNEVSRQCKAVLKDRKLLGIPIERT
jgi:hypothetical protein